MGSQVSGSILVQLNIDRSKEYRSPPERINVLLAHRCQTLPKTNPSSTRNPDPTLAWRDLAVVPILLVVFNLERSEAA